MRDRLLFSLVALTFGIVAVFLVERAYALADVVHAQEEHKVERSAEVFAGMLGDSGGQVSESLLRSALFVGEHAVYVDEAGRRVEVENHATVSHVDDHDDITVTRPVEGGGTITVTRDAALVDDTVADALLPLVMVALGLVLAGAGVALWIARRLSRPFEELAEVSAQIARGNFVVPVSRYALPEADAIALALRAAGVDLDALMRRERDFAAHASHELRTPLTATRLELEDLALSPQTPPDVVARLADALRQLDRLDTTVAEMLDATRQSRLGMSSEIDLAALLRDAATRWRRLSGGRPIEVPSDDVVPVRLPVGALLQVMDVLLGNAVTHGEGAVTVTVCETDAYVEVLVADEGACGRAAAGAKRSDGPGGDGGLSTATEIVEALGGQLRLSDAACTTFSLVLPTARRESVVA
ncbi:MAG TPA: HAMP domain-containing sensor histidine kinase [Nocardioidaceae bacterium]|nr:HAMP domain-containing sensor histidine kinase [Nocardioidaceae bacterium]